MTALIDNNLIHISAISSAYYSLAYFRPFLIFRSQRLSFLFIFILSLYSDEILTLCIKVPISYCSWCLPILTSIGLAEGKKKRFYSKMLFLFFPSTNSLHRLQLSVDVSKHLCWLIANQFHQNQLLHQQHQQQQQRKRSKNLDNNNLSNTSERQKTRNQQNLKQGCFKSQFG